MVDLEPGNPEGHHAVGHGVGLGEEILDLLAGADIPVRHTGSNHFLLRTWRQALALTDRLHNLKGTLIRHAAGDQVDHDVITSADGLVNGGCLGVDQILGIAQPHVCTVGVAADSHQEIELGRHGIQQNSPGEAGVELRNTNRTGGAQKLVVLIAQNLGGGEDGHGALVVQRDGLGIHTGHILHHADHGGVIVAQHIQLQKVFLHGVVFKMGGDLVGIGVVCRVLDRTEIPDLVFLGDNHQTAGVLAGGTADTYAAAC